MVLGGKKSTVTPRSVGRVSVALWALQLSTRNKTVLLGDVEMYE